MTVDETRAKIDANMRAIVAELRKAWLGRLILWASGVGKMYPEDGGRQK